MLPHETWRVRWLGLLEQARRPSTPQLSSTLNVRVTSFPPASAVCGGPGSLPMTPLAFQSLGLAQRMCSLSTTTAKQSVSALRACLSLSTLGVRLSVREASLVSLMSGSGSHRAISKQAVGSVCSDGDGGLSAGHKRYFVFKGWERCWHACWKANPGGVIQRTPHLVLSKAVDLACP